MPLTETPLAENPPYDSAPADTPEPNAHVPEVGVLRPRRAARRDWFRAGFFLAAGVLVLGVLAMTARHILEATLAIIAPFAVGMMLALLLDPLADALEKRGMKRLAAAGLVFVGLLVIIIGSGILLFPQLATQAGNLAQNAPAFIEGIRKHVNTFLQTHHKIGPVTLPKNVQQLGDQATDYASGLLSNAGGRAAGFLLGSVTFLVQTVLALVIAFFLLLDIDRLRARLMFLAPEKWRPMMAHISADVGDVFSKYLAGLLKVCVLYGIATTLVLYGMAYFHHGLAGYALLVGVAAGILYAVPYLGSLSTALVTFLVTFAAAAPENQGLQFGLIGIGLTLLLNQVFDNVVTPRVVGGGVGLNPVVSIFALVLGGELFGLWGMLLSVPVAGSIQVVLFRLFPKLTKPTPAPLLRAQGVRVGDEESPKILNEDKRKNKRDRRKDVPEQS